MSEEGFQLYVDWICVVKRKRSEYVKAVRKPVLNLRRNGRCQDEKENDYMILQAS